MKDLRYLISFSFLDVQRGFWLNVSQIYIQCGLSYVRDIFEVWIACNSLFLGIFSSKEFIFAKKEQCLALGTQLRTFKINDYKIYRVFPNEEVQFLHPADGVFPEKSNQGRVAANSVNRSIGKNISPAQINTKEGLEKMNDVITP